MNQYNFMDGDWDSKVYDFKKHLLEKSNFYNDVFKQNQLDIFSLSDINVFKPVDFILRVVKNAFMLIFGYPCLLFLTLILYIKILIQQSTYSKEHFNSGVESDTLTKSIKSPFGMLISYIFIPVKLFITIFFGFSFERTIGCLFGNLLKWIITPVVLSVQIVELASAISLVPFILSLFILKYVFIGLGKVIGILKLKKIYNHLMKVEIQ